MYRVFIIFLVMLLSGCGNGKENVVETVTAGSGDTSTVKTSGQNVNIDETPENQESEENRESEKNQESEKNRESQEVKELRESHKDEDSRESGEFRGAKDSGFEVIENKDNEYNRLASAAYREILKKDFPEGGYYCIVDLDGDNVYEMAAASEHPSPDGKYLSMVAYVDKKENSVEYTVLNTEQAAGFDIGYGDEKGKLLVRTGKDSVHHYVFQVKDDSLEKSDFLVLDKIMDSVDKTKDPEGYWKYLNQDRGDFDNLLMWTITEEHLNRDLSEYVSATSGFFDAIDIYLREQPDGKLYGFYNNNIEDFFSKDFTGIEENYGAPAARVLSCSLNKDNDTGNSHLEYHEKFLWCSDGTGCFVSEDNTVMGTLETFFDVRQETLTFKELQDTLGVQFYHDSLSSDYDIIFVYYGHTFYVEAADMVNGLIGRGAHVKALKNALDTGNYPLLFDSDGNITENHS